MHLSILATALKSSFFNCFCFIGLFRNCLLGVYCSHEDQFPWFQNYCFLEQLFSLLFPMQRVAVTSFCLNWRPDLAFKVTDSGMWVWKTPMMEDLVMVSQWWGAGRPSELLFICYGYTCVLKAGMNKRSLFRFFLYSFIFWSDSILFYTFGFVDLFVN